MKARNRRRMNILVVIVLCVVVAGGVFAFVSRGPLLFQGTVGAYANLELRIDRHMAGNSREISIADALAGNVLNPAAVNSGMVVLDQRGVNDTRLRDVTVSDDGRFVEFSGITFRGPGAARIHFRVVNQGTMPARFVNASSSFDEVDGISVNFSVSPWVTYEWNPGQLVVGDTTWVLAEDLDNIEPGEFFWVVMDIALVDGGENYRLRGEREGLIGEILTFTVEIEYAMGARITFSPGNDD